MLFMQTHTIYICNSSLKKNEILVYHELDTIFHYFSKCIFHTRFAFPIYRKKALIVYIDFH